MGTQIFDTSPQETKDHDFSQKDCLCVEREYLLSYKRLTGQKQYFCVGIDGCRSGWLAASISDTEFEVNVFDSIEEVLKKYDCCDSVIVDMPVGLPESPEDLRPDSFARMILRHRHPCVFPTPCRQAVYETTYEEAKLINIEVMGRGLSKQSYAICKKIKEIDEFLDRKPQYKNTLLESHPEVCFTFLNSGNPLPPKKPTEGQTTRIDLLYRYYPRVGEVIEYSNDKPRLKSLTVDIIDALCLAVTGMLGIENGLSSIPQKPSRDNRGILMQMVYSIER